jgi:imidazolonepropionase-like amidohydrolase
VKGAPRSEGKIGVIAPGAFADLLVLDANPLEDITILDRPEQRRRKCQ